MQKIGGKTSFFLKYHHTLHLNSFHLKLFPVLKYNLINSMDIIKSNHYAVLKEVITAMKNGETLNLSRLLEMLNISTDVGVQVKLFSILSAYLILNEDNFEAIVTYNPIYDKISQILAKCPPRKTTVAFNFLSALLYVDNEDNLRKNSLIAYVRNMIRCSGCLVNMCDLFTTCMMHQDAWRALCRCLAESCRGVEANQSYCTHLVPMCVQRCSQRNIEVLLVLQSLLQNHSRNISLFLECNGMSLFQREFLQHDICLQILASIVQSSAKAAALVFNTDICQQLRELLHLYGVQSQLGQWATIVLYHTSRVEASEERKMVKNKNDKLKLSKSLISKLNLINNDQEKDSSANTTMFFHNVMKEIQCSAPKEYFNLKPLFPADIIMNRSQRNTANYAYCAPSRDISVIKNKWMTESGPNKFDTNRVKPTLLQNDSLQMNEVNELSLSFLRSQNFNKKHGAPNVVRTDKLPKQIEKGFYKEEFKRDRDTTMYKSHLDNNKSHINLFNADTFEPQFASTPKRHNINEYSRQINQQSNNNKRSKKKVVKSYQVNRRFEKDKIEKCLEQSKVDYEIKHRSFSGRFFDAINTSCTTLVKTVKNIFRPKTYMNETKEDTLQMSPNQDMLSCSYSFTKYMLKRDAVLENNRSMSGGELDDFKPKEKLDEFSMENSCNTCNDTVLLKRKLANDDHLKQTIRKLKLGINLYGCDFKKISRTMWRKETYMTPAVLYNLYRKLIIK